MITYSNVPGFASAETIEIGTNVTAIATEWCDNNRTLKSIVVPSSVETIRTDAFYGPSTLTSVVFTGRTLAEVQAMANYPWGISESIISVQS